MFKLRLCSNFAFSQIRQKWQFSCHFIILERFIYRTTMHKKWSFPWRISSVNKCDQNLSFLRIWSHLLKKFWFFLQCQWIPGISWRLTFAQTDHWPFPYRSPTKRETQSRFQKVLWRSLKVFVKPFEAPQRSVKIKI